MTLGSYIFRRNCKKSDTKRDEGLTTPSDIERFDDIKYGPDEKWHVLDVYRPKDMPMDPMPVIVSAHGGGWIYGDKEVYQYYCMNLAQRGFVVVNYTYRLAPKYKFPAQIEDTNMVFEWLMEHASQYAMDTDNIFLLGDSAGGQITGIYTNILCNSEYAGRFDFKAPEGLKLKAIGLNCGKYNLANDASDMFVKDLFKNKGTEAERDMLSVTNHVTDAWPPCYIFTATKDFLIDEPKALIEKLDKYSIEYEFKIYGDKEHDLYHVFHCDIKTEAAKITNDDECNFFKKIARNDY